VGRVLAVNVVAQLRPEPTNPSGVTAIDKRPLEGPVAVGPLGIEGDHVEDTRHHGGPDQAVYAYAVEDARWWARELGRDVPPGLFGENLTVEGVDVTGAVVGERWRIGGERPDAVELEVRMPRTPCATFARRMGEPRWVRRFADHGALGAYLAVRRPGVLSAGDPVEVVHRPAHGVTVAQVFRAAEVAPDKLRFMLAQSDVAAPVERAVRLALRDDVSG
jgi:MOSC domain-containing protein YiiM